MPLADRDLDAIANRLSPRIDFTRSPVVQVQTTAHLIEGGLLDDLAMDRSVRDWIETAKAVLQRGPGHDAEVRGLRLTLLAAALSRQALRLLGDQRGLEGAELRGSAWWTLAQAHQQTNDLGGAADGLARAAAAYRIAGAQEKAARALSNRGLALADLGRLGEALADYDEAIALTRSLIAGGRPELRRDLAGALSNRGAALKDLGRLGEALATFDEAIALTRSLIAGGRPELRRDLGRALNNRGAALADLGRLGEALADYDEAIALTRSLIAGGRPELRRDLAGALSNRGLALKDLGRLGEALADYDEAIALTRSLIAGGRPELRRDLGRALNNRGLALKDLGRLGEALADYDEAIALRRSLIAGGRPELRHDLASALSNRGLALKDLGRLGEALAAFDEAIALTRSLIAGGRPELRHDLGRALSNRGLALKEQGRLGEALADYDEAIALRRSLIAGGRPELRHDLASALSNRGLALKEQGRLGEALAAFDEAIALTRSLIAGGRPELRRDLASALSNRGLALKDLGRLGEALAAFDEAIALCRDTGEPALDVHWRTLLNLARLQRPLGEILPAAAAIAEAIPLVERLAGRIPTLDDRLHLRENVLDVYKLAALLAVERSDRAGAFLAAQHAKGRTLVELRTLRLEDDPAESPERRLAELTLADYWIEAKAGDADRPGTDAPEGDGLRSASARAAVRDEQQALKAQLAERQSGRALLAFGVVRSLEELISMLRPGEALLDGFDVDERVILNLVLPGQAEIAWAGEVEQTALSEALGWWNDAQQFPNDALRWAEALDELGTLLLAPVLPLLHENGVHHLILSPSGRLHRLPFAALRIAGSDGEGIYLADRYDLSLVPTATSLWFLRQEARASWPPALVAAAPFAPAAHLDHLMVPAGRRRELREVGDQTLPGTEREARAIAELVRDSGGRDTPVALLLGAQATRDAATGVLPAVKLALLATHGGASVTTGVLDYQLWFHADDAGRARLSVGEVFGGALPLEGVFQLCLTACHLGEVVLRGEEALGFAQAFLSAGAGVVLAPLWAVDDVATCELSIAYHEALLSPERPTVAEAWRRAMGKIRTDPDHPEWEHPFYWAGFLPNGDGTLRLIG